jgi:hypothetical protein
LDYFHSYCLNNNVIYSPFFLINNKPLKKNKIIENEKVTDYKITNRKAKEIHHRVKKNNMQLVISFIKSTIMPNAKKIINR